MVNGLFAAALIVVLFSSPGFAGKGGWSAEEISKERAYCADVLKGLQLNYEQLDPLGKKGGCGSPAPILIKSIAGVAIFPPAEANCDFAENLHGWVTASLIIGARLHLKKELSVIHNASAYVCRRRNNSSRGKLSEHARANAFDIATLEFSDGSKVTVKGDWSGVRQMVGKSAQGKFLRHIRRDACIRFTTVLGPGSDRHHGDHFHVDLARRKSGYRICK
jgi:hypothetical protein